MWAQCGIDGVELKISHHQRAGRTVNWVSKLNFFGLKLVKFSTKVYFYFRGSRSTEILGFAGSCVLTSFVRRMLQSFELCIPVGFAVQLQIQAE